MWHCNRWVVAVLIIVSLQLVACGQTPPGPESSSPARVEHLGQTGLSRVILTPEAAKRLGIETTLVSEVRDHGTLRKVVPYSALIYDLNGDTWVYTNPASLTFLRAHVIVDRIDNDLVVLSEGPPSGTAIVTVGVSELYGTEFGIEQ